MKKYFYSVLVLAVFAIGFTASEETEKSNGSEQKEETVKENKQEDSQPKENPDIQHFVGDYFYSYFIGNTNARMYFKLSLKADGSFTLEPTNRQTKDWINIEKVMDGNDFPEGGDWEVKDTPAGKGAFLDFDGDWDEGTITYDRNVLAIKNMNGFNLKTELKYEAPKELSEESDSSFENDSYSEDETSDIHVSESVSSDDNENNKTSNEIIESDTRCWYVYGTKKELEEQGIIIHSSINKKSLNKEYFTEVDNERKEIKLYSQSAEVLSNHPSDSYELRQENNGNYKLCIINPESFWSSTKFLVVVVK